MPSAALFRYALPTRGAVGTAPPEDYSLDCGYGNDYRSSVSWLASSLLDPWPAGKFLVVLLFDTKLSVEIGQYGMCGPFGQRTME